MNNNPKIKEVSRAIILIDGKVLLGKRARGRGANQFALVGGKPEEGESIEKAVVREVKEELGILFTNSKIWKDEIDNSSVPGESWRVCFFYGNGKGKLKLKADEISEVVYVDKSDFLNFDIAFDHKDILSKFFKEIDKI